MVSRLPFRVVEPSMSDWLLRRRAALRLSLAGALIGVVATTPRLARAGYNVFTGEFTIGLDELQRQVARRFPVQQRYAELFVVTLSNPVLTLDGAANRARIGAQLLIENPLFDPQRVDGVLALSSALVYDAASRALRLQQPRTDRLELRGLSGQDAERLQRIGALVAQELLQGYALHTFTDDELTAGRKNLRIGAITIEDAQVRVEVS